MSVFFHGVELPQSKPDGFDSSLGEGASGAAAKFAPEIPPQSLRDSSPKGTPFGAAAKFPATAKAVPLGKVSCRKAARRKG